MHIIIKQNYLTIRNYKAKCSVGKRGIGNKKKEGDLITPKGLYKIKHILYRKDRIKKFESKIKKIIIKKNMGWCDDPFSKSYNKIVKLPSRFSHEKLYRKDNIYDIILVLNYNMSPIVKNKGSAIFIHVSKKNYKKTKGCIGLKKIHLLKIIKELKKNTKVMIESQK
ncbi:L,D-transpeptidase family protein [Candidatus Pelagibacter bacterium]|jgi:L,D-peptidoglycan transpeptidase YkuD (ErfK/YbiS/YcfS/YnhG family)|nr:L,D-transpeptidase family protein [Candidatus Pelagibacter bacterium]